MKYEVFELLINTLIENNIELDNETFDILLNIKSFNKNTKTVLETIFLDENIKDKKKFLNYMVNIDDDFRAMNTFLKILKDPIIRENDQYIKIIMYQFEDFVRDYIYDALHIDKVVNDKELLDFIIKQQELIQVRIIKCLKSGMSEEQIEKLKKTDINKVKTILTEIEDSLIEDLKKDLETLVNKVYQEPTIDNLKELKVKQQEYNEFFSTFKQRIDNKRSTISIEKDKEKKLVFTDNI